MNGILHELKTYSVADIARMGWSFVMTKLFYPGAMLVRRPICIRQKKDFHFGCGLSTGRNCRIEVFGSGCIEMGERCQIGDNVHLVSSSRLSIGDDCLFASKVFVSDTSHGSYGAGGSAPCTRPADRPLDAEPVTIGDRVWLGRTSWCFQVSRLEMAASLAREPLCASHCPPTASPLAFRRAS